MAKKDKFPVVVYVAREHESDGTEWLVAQEDYTALAELNGDVAVGVYRLVEVRTVSAKAELK